PNTGTFMVPATHGRAAVRPAPTPMREGRTRRGKCCVFSLSIRSTGKRLHSALTDHTTIRRVIVSPCILPARDGPPGRAFRSPKYGRLRTVQVARGNTRTAHRHRLRVDG